MSIVAHVNFVTTYTYIEPLKYNSYKAYAKLIIHTYNPLPIMHTHSH